MVILMTMTTLPLAEVKLLDHPQRVGKRPQAPLDDRHSARRGTYRVLYRIDDAERTVTVVDITRPRDAYRVLR